jgi:hypothetical protein
VLVPDTRWRRFASWRPHAVATLDPDQLVTARTASSNGPRSVYKM